MRRKQLKRINEKIATLFLICLISLAITGYTYSHWTDMITILGTINTGSLKITIENQKLIPDIGYSKTPDNKTVTISAEITTGWQIWVGITIQNKGTCPIHFDSVTIINRNPEALDITTTNHTCTWLSPCETVKGKTTVHTLEPAQQNGHYTFQIKIGVTCQKEYPRTICFWKNQFFEALCKSGRPQVSASTLLTYLNQISNKSAIFKFTGTQTQKFQQALNILSPSINANMKDKLKAQLLALWLNYVAGWTEGYKVNGKTAWDIIQGSEYALLHNLTSDYGKWKDFCNQFNNLG